MIRGAGLEVFPANKSYLSRFAFKKEWVIENEMKSDTVYVLKGNEIIFDNLKLQTGE